MDDTLWNHITGAKSKRQDLQPDAPSQQPMRAGIKPADRKAPSSDQKRVRRQMSKSASVEETQMSTQHTEADLLAKMAAATTLAEQSRWGQALDEFRASRRDQIAAEGSLDFDAMGADLSPTYDLTPLTATASMGHSAGGLDWLADVSPETHDDQKIATTMNAEATLWYEALWAPVKEDSVEFAIQARNAARRAAAQFGLQSEAAASVFEAKVSHLHEASVRTADANEVPDSASGAIPNGSHHTPPKNSDTFDGVVNGEHEHGHDPKTETSDAPSLAEGDAPAGDQAPSGTAEISDTDGAKYVKDTAQGTTYTDPLQASSARREAKVEVEPYSGPVKECTIPGCDGNPQFVVTKDGRTDPGYRQVACSSHVGDLAGNMAKKSSRKTSGISLKNVGIEGEHGVGTDPQGNRVKFRLSPKDKADLKAVLYSDLAMNFSGVEIEESDIVKDASGKTSSLFAAVRRAFASEDPKSTSFTTETAPSLAEGDAPAGDHAESPVKEVEPAQDKSTWGPATDYLDGTTASLATLGHQVAAEARTDNVRTFGRALSMMGSLDDSLSGFTGREVVAMVLATGDVSAPTARALQNLAAEYQGGSPKSGDTAVCHADGEPIEFFDYAWYHLKGGPSHNDVYPATPRERAEKTSAKSDECPKCGAHMKDVTVNGDTLTAKCDACGWSGSKKKASLRTAGDVPDALKEQWDKGGEASGSENSPVKCSVCGDAVKKDDSGDGSWHHDNGEKHDHEAKPGGSKESAFHQGMEMAEVSTIPDCDVCKVDEGKTTPAAYDGKTVMGPWAFMCEQHMNSHGIGLGMGRGQRLVKRSMRGDSAPFVREAGWAILTPAGKPLWDKVHDSEEEARKHFDSVKNRKDMLVPKDISSYQVGKVSRLVEAAGYGWPMQDNPNFPGEQMLACPKCGGPVTMSGVPLSDRFGGGTTLTCQTCGHSEFFPESRTGSRHTAAGSTYQVKKVHSDTWLDGGESTEEAGEVIKANVTGSEEEFWLVRNNFNGAVNVYAYHGAMKGIDSSAPPRNMGTYQQFYGQPYREASLQSRVASGLPKEVVDHMDEFKKPINATTWAYLTGQSPEAAKRSIQFHIDQGNLVNNHKGSGFSLTRP